MSRLKQKEKDWWRHYFNEAYFHLYKKIISEDTTSNQLFFIENLCKKNNVKSILDIGCGYGRLAIPLAQSGFEVTAIDTSVELLKIAQTEAEKKRVPHLKFVKKDMRSLAFQNKFQAAICMFSTFGYFASLQDFQIVLKKIFVSLEVNGFLLLDLNSRADILAKVLRSTDREEHLFIKKRWIMLRKSLPNMQYASTYIFSKREITNLLRLSGFHLIKFYGNFLGKSFQSTDRRMIIFAKK